MGGVETHRYKGNVVGVREGKPLPLPLCLGGGCIGPGYLELKVRTRKHEEKIRLYDDFTILGDPLKKVLKKGLNVDVKFRVSKKHYFGGKDKNIHGEISVLGRRIGFKTLEQPFRFGETNLETSIYPQ